MRILFALALLLVAVPAAAQHQERKAAVVCDRPEQVELMLERLDTDYNKAAEAVNTEVQTHNACVWIPIQFVKGDVLSTVWHKTGTYEIIKIMVIAVLTPSGPKVGPPIIYYMAYRLDGHNI